MFYFYLFFSDDRGEAMSSPSPGWQETGAPCTGKSLFVPPSFLLFFESEHYNTCWGIQLSKRNLVSSRWLCIFVMLICSRHTRITSHIIQASSPTLVWDCFTLSADKLELFTCRFIWLVFALSWELACGKNEILCHVWTFMRKTKIR